MVRRILSVGAGVGLGAAGLLAFVMTAMRTKSPRLLGAVRRFNRAVTNRWQMRSAGTPGAYASVLRHRGRRSGREYETPIVPFETDDGFLIALPYGAETDWLANVQAAGRAELVHNGVTYRVDTPRVVATETVIDQLPVGEQRTLRWFKVGDTLHLRHGADAASED